MSMHLLPCFVTTTNMKKRKQKRSKKQDAVDAAHTKFLKKMGYNGPVVQRSEPAAHNGVVVGSNPAGPTNKRSLAQSGSAPALGAGGQKFESSNSDQFYNISSAKKDEKVYSGERKLLGIATMHKSNMVPVFSTEDAEALAKMRR